MNKVCMGIWGMTNLRDRFNVNGFGEEVAVIDRTRPSPKSPIFVEAESPYKLPNMGSDLLTVIVRAIDRAGNIREASVETRLDAPGWWVILRTIIIILFIVGLIALAYFIFSPVWRIRIVAYLRKLKAAIRRRWPRAF